MASRTSRQPSTNERGRLLVPRSQLANELRDRVERGLELRERPIRSSEDLQQERDSYYTWTEYNAQLLKRRFSTDELHDEYASSIGFIALGSQTHQEDVAEFREDISSKIRRLESIVERLELYDEPTAEPTTTPRAAKIDASGPGEIFVVHGRSEGPKQEVARFLEAVTNRRPVILHEQVSGGMTVIEKLEHYADRIGFAVVVLTGDDEGRMRGTEDALLPRGRENVVLELGFFIGRLNRSRVILLHESDVTLPSDVLGVVYVRLDNAGGWKLSVAKELRAAGYVIDANRMV